MPLLSEEQQKTMLGPVDGFHCPDCGWQKWRGYCRQCDEFYLRCGCPIPPNDRHNEHRTYEPLEAGALYLVEGNVMRCQGLYEGKGPCYAFATPREPMHPDHVGYSARIEHAMKLTGVDLPMLRRRLEEARPRKLDEVVLDLAHAIFELEHLERVKAELDMTKGPT
jgi:hypothetical protein